MCFSSRRLCLLLAGASLHAAPLSIRTQELPWAAIGVDYRAAIQIQVDGRCPQGDVVLSLVAGSLPRGITLEGNWLEGSPKELGIFRFRVRGANICSTANRDLVLLVTGKPVLRVAPDTITFDCRKGDAPPLPQILLVSSTWPEVTYSVAGALAWLKVGTAAGTTPYPGAAFSADRVTVEVIPKDLAPGTYSAVLVFHTRQGATAPEIPVLLRVLPAFTPQIEFPVPAATASTN